MSDYNAPVTDILFTMKAIAGLDALTALPGYADATADTVQAILEGRDVAFERFSRRVLTAGVFVAFVVAQPLLHVRRGEVDRRHDRSGQWVGALAGVNRTGSKTRREVLIKNTRHDDTLVYGSPGKITAWPDRRNLNCRNDSP